jgi:hypothetical protein
MRCLIAPALALVLGIGHAVAADPAPKTFDPKDPISAVMTPVTLLRSNDFKGFYELMPAEDKAKAETEWKASQAKAAAGGDMGDQGQMAEFNAFLAKCLAPNAVETLYAEAEPKLADINPQEISQQLQMFSGMVPMMAMQQGGQQDPQKQQFVTALGGMMLGASQWILTAGLEDKAKLRQAITHLVAGAKGLGVKEVKELQALPLDQFLGRLGPVVKEMKAAAAIYDIQADPFLDSVKATAQGDGNERTLAVAFTAFGKPYTLPVKVELKDGHWVVSQKNAKAMSMGPMGGMGNDPAMPLDPK